MINGNRLGMLCAIAVAAAALRLLPHPPNFAPIGALALFSGAFWAGSGWAFAVPLAGLLLSDVAIGIASGQVSNGFHPLIPVVYGSFLATVAIGSWLRSRRSLGRIATASLVTSLLFFVATNLGTWALTDWYPRTGEGLVACYLAALPFFQYTLAGDAAYTAVLFGGWALLRHATLEWRRIGMDPGLLTPHSVTR